MVPILEAHTSLPGLNNVKVGTCRFSLRRGQLSSSFSYDDSYLERPQAYAIDPALPLRRASYHSSGIPGAFRDSSPDRWGRHLIDRRALYAKDEDTAGSGTYRSPAFCSKKPRSSRGAAGLGRGYVESGSGSNRPLALTPARTRRCRAGSSSRAWR